jgi:outer membrane protein OmpA-like peptidoglycan-associated protein
MAWGSPEIRVTPQLRLSCDPPAFSPNGDGVKDRTFIQPFLNVPDQVKKWEMVIKSHLGKTIKKTSGYDDLPALLTWGGEDQKGRMVKEGLYTIKLTVWGRESGRLSASSDVALDVTPPAVELAVSTPSFSPGPNGSPDRIVFQSRAEDSSGIDHWELTIQREGGRAVKIWRSTGTVPGVLDWDGRDEHYGVVVPPGHYLATLAAWDTAGNAGHSSPAAFEINSQTPSILVASLKRIGVGESASGWVVKLSASDLFVEDGAAPPLKPGAWDFLNELTYLLQAYPDRPCLIEGFSRHHPSPALDASLSSAWAWRVYSTLVKSGVNAKRLEVRGRGRASAASLKAQDFDGVIVTLMKNKEGNP